METIDSPPSGTGLDGGTGEALEPAVWHRRRIGRFEILGLLGRGSFGTVYRAHDSTLDRDVALKVPRFPPDQPKKVKRFLREARAEARLRHPNIVPVYESGRDGTDIYIASECIDGHMLSSLLAKERIEVRQAVRWVRDLADALAYAHEEGIVHRDIKPSNIMISQTGRPQLMDFGLAKLQTDDTDMTLAGSVLGTPSYMSPEQARGDIQATGPLSDQYSLGAVLYYMLTGRKPFQGPPHSVVSQAASRETEPVAPRVIAPEIPKDLEACCLKAMAKEPSDRYAGAADFADDLQRWLDGRTLQARSLHGLERLWRWCRRNRAVAALIGLVAVLLVSGAVAAVLIAIQFRYQKNKAEAARDREIAALKVTERALTDVYTTLGLIASDQGDPAQAALWFAEAANRAQNFPTRQRLNRIRFRSWTHQLPKPIHVFPQDDPWLRELQFHPSGRYLLTCSGQAGCTIWDLREGRSVELPGGDGQARCAAWSRDGKWLALGGQENARLYRFPSGALVKQLPGGGPVSAVAFSEPGLLAVAGPQVLVWDCVRGEPRAPSLPHPARVVYLVFNRRGDRLVTASVDGMSRVFATERGTPSATPLFPPVPNMGPQLRTDFPLRPVFVDDGRGLLTLTGECELTWWDASSGVEVRRVSIRVKNRPAAIIMNAVSAPGGGRFAVCGYQGAQLYDAHTGEPTGPCLEHLNYVYSAVFGQDGKKLMTVSADRTSRLWSAASGLPLTPPLRHQAEVRLAAFSPDGTGFATAQTDGLVRVWKMGQDMQTMRIPTGATESFVRLGPHGRTVMISGWNRQRNLQTVQVYEVATGRKVGPSLELNGLLNSAALSPDDRTMLTLSSSPDHLAEKDVAKAGLEKLPGQIQLWDWPSGEPRSEPLSTPSEPIGAAFRPDGKLAVVVCGGGQILVIDPDTGRTTKHLDHGATVVPGYMVRDWVRFSPDGKVFATWGLGNTVIVWDAHEPARLYSVSHHEGTLCNDVNFSPGGLLFVTASADKYARVWDTKTGRQVGSTLSHPDWVFAARFSPNHRHVLTACRDHMARLWDVDTGNLVCPALEHGDEVFGLDFSPDGQFLFTSSRDGTARIWEWETGKPVTPGLALDGPGYQILAAPSGRHAVVAGAMARLHVLNLDDLYSPKWGQEDLEAIRRWAEILSGQTVRGGEGGVVNLTSAGWLRRWKELQTRYPEFRRRHVPTE